MRAAEKAGTEECPVKMKLVAPPLYVLTTQAHTQTEFLRLLFCPCWTSATEMYLTMAKLMLCSAHESEKRRCWRSTRG